MKRFLLSIIIFTILFVWEFSQAGFLLDNSDWFNWNILCFLFIFLILSIIIVLVVYKFVKNKNKLVVVQYSPPKWIDSAKAGLLLYRRSDPVFILSLIYKWAGDWLISINTEEVKSKNVKDKKMYYILHKKKEISEIAPSYEILFWKSLFDSWEIAKVGGDIELVLNPSLKAMEEYWYNSWWFDKNGFMYEPGFIVMCIIVALMILLWIIPNSTENKEYMSLFLIILYVIFYSFPKIWVLVWIEIPKLKKMKLTQKGENLVLHILWYREFLRTCDAEVLKTFLKQDHLYFDNILSYAIVFWIESELIEKLHSILDEIGLKLYVSKLKNPLYDILHDNTEYSNLTETWNSSSVVGNESWWWFK